MEAACVTLMNPSAVPHSQHEGQCEIGQPSGLSAKDSVSGVCGGKTGGRLILFCIEDIMFWKSMDIILIVLILFLL